MGKCVECSVRFFAESAFCAAFTVTFMGWAFGWATVSGMYSAHRVSVASLYAALCTALAVFLYFIRSRAHIRKYEKWKIQNGDGEERALLENENENFESSNVFAVGEETHRALRALANWNLFFRKGFGFMIALPWEILLDLAMERYAVYVRFLIAIAATAVLSDLGLRFVEIEEEMHAHNSVHTVAEMLRMRQLNSAHRQLRYNKDSADI